VYQPETVTETVLLEKKTLEFALSDWKNMPTIGGLYTAQIQKDVSCCSLYCTTVQLATVISSHSRLFTHCGGA